MKSLLIAILVLFGSTMASVSLASSSEYNGKGTLTEMSLTDGHSHVLKNLQDDISGSSAILTKELSITVVKAGYIDSAFVTSPGVMVEPEVVNKGSPK